MKYLICLFIGLWSLGALMGQCGLDESMLVVDMHPDDYPQEIHWFVYDDSGNELLSGGSVSDSVCINTNSCITFTITDSAGDGICCGYGIGNYNLLINSVVVYESDGNYHAGESFEINCPPGTGCGSAFDIALGTHTAEFDNSWFSYTPTVTGMYSISTCELNTCDTKIWVYSTCSNLNINETNVGSQKYDDDDGGCGEQAVATMVMMANTSYYIRIGDDSDDCVNSIDFTLSYDGPVVGCMDNTACNYNALATEAGDCFFPGNPECPGGPDLVANQNEFVNSLSIVNAQASLCDIQEGCLRDYGNRSCITFTTYISNFGEQDYYIGSPSLNPGQFSNQNCHGHTHYEGYTKSIVYDSENNVIPVGVKNGFCVMDLVCPSGEGQFSCDPMGISAGCADIYGAGTQCQWFDITDLPAGQYKLAMKVNWDNSPDALGQNEMSYDNNWAYACIDLTYNDSGNPSFVVLPNCEPVVDCFGVAFGTALTDCSGTCGGTAVMGDFDSNGNLGVADVETYLQLAVQNSDGVTTCNDLSADGDLDVYDAALANWCRIYGAEHLHGGGALLHNHCDFPRNVLNPEDSTLLGITAFDLNENYIDISIINPYCRINGYEFSIKGADIVQVQSLVSASSFPLFIDQNGWKVVALSVEDSTLQKQMTPQPLCRIYFENQTGSIGIDEIEQIINKDHERVPTGIFGSEILLSGISGVETQYFNIYPNPASDVIHITGDFAKQSIKEIAWYDVLGAELTRESINLTHNSDWSIQVPNLPKGLYFVHIMTNTGMEVKPLVLK